MRGWLHEHREGIFLILAVLAMGAAIVAWGEYQDREDERRADALAAQERAERIAGCERGNVIRAYLAYDNEQRITRLRQQLANPAQITPADVRAFRAELQDREARAERLVNVACATLR